LISLLVAVLLNVTSKSLNNTTATPESHAALLEAEIERERVENELRDLHEAVKKQNVVKGTLLPEGLIEEGNKYQRAAQKHTDFVTQKTTKVHDASQAQVEINNFNRSTAERKKELDAARNENAKLNKELKQMVAKRSRDAATPKLSEARTEPEVFFVIKKRLYGPWHTGKFDRFNDIDFTQTTHQGHEVLRPKPGGGIEISLSSNDKTAITEKFAEMDVVSEHAMILVWPDSYAEFDAIRQTLAQKHIKLDLVPWLDGKEVTIGQRSDVSPSQVQ
jgi:hypothetical protein